MKALKGILLGAAIFSAGVGVGILITLERMGF